MKILVIGPGCPRCQTTEKNLMEAVKQLNINAEITHIYDPREYSKYGVMLTPAVIVDGKVVVAGRVPSTEEVKKIISQIAQI